MLFLAILLVSLHLELCSGAGDADYTALKFGADKNSYIRYSPDMRAFTNAFTLCSWLKRLRSSGWPAWFTYRNDKAATLKFYDKGLYYVLGYHGEINLMDKFSSTIGQGVWYHVCISWSFLGNRARVYWNGELSGETTTPSGNTIPAGQTLVIGHDEPDNRWEDDRYFGGEMYGLNMYDRELTSDEIRDIFKRGRCSGAYNLLEDSRVLKWEDVLQQTRSGNIREIDTCNQMVEKLAQCTKRLEEVTKEAEACRKTEVVDSPNGYHGRISQMKRW